MSRRNRKISIVKRPAKRQTVEQSSSRFVARVVTPSDAELERVELGELTDLEKRLLRESGVPDLVEMADDDPEKARRAALRRLRIYLEPAAL